MLCADLPTQKKRPLQGLRIMFYPIPNTDWHTLHARKASTLQEKLHACNRLIILKNLGGSFTTMRHAPTQHASMNLPSPTNTEVNAKDRISVRINECAAIKTYAKSFSSINLPSMVNFGPSFASRKSSFLSRGLPPNLDTHRGISLGRQSDICLCN